MSSEIHSAMHREHKSWEAEYSLWRDDIRAWQQEITTALSELKEVEKLFNAHAESLRTHAAAFRLLEMDSGTHEHALADYEKGAVGEELVPLATKHLAESDSQRRHRDAHERIKHYHRALIARMNQLIKTMRQPM